MELGNKALFHEGSDVEFAAELERMGLKEPDGVKEHLYHRLLLTALEAAS